MANKAYFESRKCKIVKHILFIKVTLLVFYRNNSNNHSTAKPGAFGNLVLELSSHLFVSSLGSCFFFFPEDLLLCPLLSPRQPSNHNMHLLRFFFLFFLNVRNLLPLLPFPILSLLPYPHSSLSHVLWIDQLPLPHCLHYLYFCLYLLPI